MERQYEEIIPTVWKPLKEGDTFEGRIISRERNIGIDNKSTLYHFENNTGQFVIWGCTVLDDRMSYVNDGDYVRITFKGLKQNKKGQDVKIYKVERQVNA